MYPEFVASPNHAVRGFSVCTSPGLGAQKDMLLTQLSEETTTGLYELSTTDHAKVELPTVA